jgi:hypothetical protein
MARPKRVEQQVNEIAEQIDDACTKLDAASVPDKKYEPSFEMSRKEKKNARRLEPIFALKVKTVRMPKDEELRYRNYMWEYIEGVAENRIVIGETIKFWRNPFPGDDYSYWEVPVGVAISVPRWLAKHLAERQWVQFDYKEKDAKEWKPRQMAEEFVPAQKIARTTFMATGSY